MILSSFILKLVKFRLRGIKYVNFYVSYDIPPIDYPSFFVSDKTLTVQNFSLSKK